MLKLCMNQKTSLEISPGFYISSAAPTEMAVATAGDLLLWTWIIVMGVFHWEFFPISHYKVSDKLFKV